MDQISIDPRSEKAYEESRKRLRFLVNSFNESKESLLLSEQIETEKGTNNGPSPIKVQKGAHWGTILSILVRRSYKNLFRNPVVIVTRMMQTISFGIILSLCYLRIDNDQLGVQNMQGFLYECLALLFVGLLNAVAICEFEKGQYHRLTISRSV